MPKNEKVLAEFFAQCYLLIKERIEEIFFLSQNLSKCILTSGVPEQTQ